MAIVENKATGTTSDKPLETFNRSGAGTPNGTITPQFAGEIYWDTTNKVRWKAVGLTNADWRSMDVEVT